MLSLCLHQRVKCCAQHRRIQRRCKSKRPKSNVSVGQAERGPRQEAQCRRGYELFMWRNWEMKLLWLAELAHRLRAARVLDLRASRVSIGFLQGKIPSQRMTYKPCKALDWEARTDPCACVRRQLLSKQHTIHPVSPRSC